MKERSKEQIPLSPHLEVIVGPMFSGKSGELIERLIRHRIANRNVVAFKPSIDDRYEGKEKINTHAGGSFEAFPIDKNNPTLILDRVNTLPEPPEVIGIDEAQFFSPDIVKVSEALMEAGKVVIVAALPTNFRGEPFGSVPLLLAKADRLDRIHAVCVTCGGEADFTQRVVNGKPAEYDEPEVLVGAQEFYEARCRRHHEVSGKPALK